MSGPVVLLGPQRPYANLRATLDALPDGGRQGGAVVFITAGWRLDEADQATLRREHHPDAVSMPIYAAFEQIASAAPELASAYKERQARIRKLKSLYRMRLHPGLAVVRKLVARLREDPALVRPFLDAAVTSLREIDDGFLRAADAVHGRFDGAHDPLTHPEVAAIRARAVDQLASARAVVIAGGHVGVLRNRLAFFGIGDLLSAANAAGVALVAWSAGAMALTERVVLFHDDPPHGAGDAELLDRGLGLLRDLVLFPNAASRLRLDDGPRVASVARRFGPARCVALESGARIELDHGRWLNRGSPETAGAFTPTGQLVALPTVEGGEHAPRP